MKGKRTFNELQCVALTILLSLSFPSCGSSDSDPEIDSTVDSTSEEDDDTITVNGYEVVDLGLSVRWATCNVGADSPEDYGNYYAWGEIETKYEYTTDNSVFEVGVSKIDFSGDAEYDAATANWGSPWRMPTYDELNELIGNCIWTSTRQNSVKGYLVTGTTGNSIFLPAAGYRDGSAYNNIGSFGYYWSSSPGGPHNLNGYYLTFLGGYRMTYGSPYIGRSVRPVTD